jgi:predicted amidohydrolase YtcJ
MMKMPSVAPRFLGAMSACSAGISAPNRSVLHNANILTVDAAQPRAQAVAIAGGRFFAVGSNDDVRRLAKAGIRQVDIGGKTVVPGFIDAHTHPSYAGIRHLRWVDCDLRSIADIQQAIRERAAKTPAGDWVIGFKYDDTKTKEGRKLTRDDLDAAAPAHPVFIEHRGGHTAYVNSLALRRTEVTDATADPQGGKFDRDPATGHLTGGLRENATVPFRKLIPTTFTRDEMRQGVKLISQMMVRTGVTSVHDAEADPADLLAYQDAREAGELLFRVYCFMQYQFLERMTGAGIRTGLGDDWLRVGAVKLVCDGSISERTAKADSAVRGTAQRLRNSREQRGRALRECTQSARGRVANRHARQWRCRHRHHAAHLRRLQREMPRRDPRYRLEHCTVVNPALIGPSGRSAPSRPRSPPTCTITRENARVRCRAPRLDVCRAQFLDAGFG